jgi:hypothetical protein
MADERGKDSLRPRGNRRRDGLERQHCGLLSDIASDTAGT